MFCASACGSAGAADAGAASAAVTTRETAAISRRMAAQRASRASVTSDPLEQEDRDLPVGLLLVLGVRRVLLDRALPPLRALGALGDPGAVGRLVGAVLEVDLGVLDEVVVPGRVVGRAALGRDRGVHAVVLHPHDGVLAQLAGLGALR